MKARTMKMTDDEWNLIASRAKAQGISASNLIRRALDHYLGRNRSS